MTPRERAKTYLEYHREDEAWQIIRDLLDELDELSQRIELLKLESKACDCTRNVGREWRE